MCLFRATFAKPLLRSFTFAHVWRLAIYMHLNMFPYASIRHIFTRMCMALNSYNIQHPIENCKRKFIHKNRNYAHKLDIYAYIMNKNAEKVRKGLAKQIKRGYNTSIVNSQHIYFI